MTKRQEEIFNEVKAFLEVWKTKYKVRSCIVGYTFDDGDVQGCSSVLSNGAPAELHGLVKIMEETLSGSGEEAPRARA